MSQETINYETKINDLKKAMKEILNTPIYSLQVCVDLKMFVPILEPIFTRYNISRIRFAKYIGHIFTYIKRILEAQGKNFDSKSELCIIALISGEDLLSIIKIFIYFIMGIKDNNEISKIQQQIISELNQQKFESQDNTNGDSKETRSSISNAIYKTFDYNISENSNSKSGNDVKIFGHTLPKKINIPYSIFSNNKSNTNDLSSSEILFSSENEFDENQIIKQQIEQVELDQDPNELSNLINILRNMFDKLSEDFSPQAIKNVINFLEDILKNNNDNEINSVCNIIHEFDEINPISVVHFLHNFSKHYPLLMDEKFDFKKMVDFIDNELFEQSINYWNDVSNIYDFYNLMDAVEWNFSLLQYKYLAKNFLSEIEKISNKTIEQIIKPSRLIHVTQILNQNDLKILRNKLIIPGKDYPMERTQDDLKREKIAKCNNELLNLQYQSKILSDKEYKCISDFFVFIVNNNETEKINHVCALIFNSQNGIDRALVESLFELASLFQIKNFHIPSGLVKDFITSWVLNYDMHRKSLNNKIEVSSKFQPILNLAEALRNNSDELSKYFSNEQIINLIYFIGDICEENNINAINSISNMIKEFTDISDISSIIHFLHNFLRCYPEARVEEPIPKSEIDKPEIEH